VVRAVGHYTRRTQSGGLRHRHLARWTLPLWLYVSVTGVVVSLMLYQLYPVSESGCRLRVS